MEMKEKDINKEMEAYKHIYKRQIIEMVQEQEDTLFLQQIYTIMIRRKRKAGV